ncbi:hypothetical protein, partial [Streptomyces lasiicapitis]|uniref:hypothetical protein n=1 Tax=Streptomyces lasiicapitis TaxID=1923961 RepID=UPI003691EC7C
MITTRALPRDVRAYTAFLQVCEITGCALLPWFDAWAKVRGLHILQPLHGEPLFNEWLLVKARKAPGRAELSLVVVDGQQRRGSLARVTG